MATRCPRCGWIIYPPRSATTRPSYQPVNTQGNGSRRFPFTGFFKGRGWYRSEHGDRYLYTERDWDSWYPD